MAFGTVNSNPGSGNSKQYVKTEQVGAAEGVASLDKNKKLPVSQLPGHASLHGAGGEDPITPSMIGAVAAKDFQWKIYNNLSQIGVTVGSETIEDIFAAMPDYSILRYVMTSGHNGAIYPYCDANNRAFGVVEFRKLNDTYADATCYGDVTDSSNRGLYSLFKNGSNIYGWFKNYDEHNKPAPADIGAAPTDHNHDGTYSPVGHTHTAGDVGAAVAATHNLTTYTDLSQIGLTAGSETLLGINSALPNASKLVISIDSNPGNIYPTGNGVLEVIRHSTSRTSYRFTRANGAHEVWIGSFYANAWRGWYRVMDSSQITASTEDITAGITALATGAQYLVFE